MKLSRLILLGLLALGADVSAQDEPVPVEPEVVADAFNRGTPLRSAEGSKGRWRVHLENFEFHGVQDTGTLRDLRIL